MARKGQKQNPLSYQYRDEIIQKILNGSSAAQLSREYGISEKTIDNWMHKIRHQEDYPGFGRKRGRPVKNEEADWKERYEILKKYRAFLKAQRERK